LQIAARASRIEVVYVGVLSGGDGPSGTTDDLPVLEHLGAQGDRRYAYLVTERDILPRYDLTRNLTLQRARLTFASGIDQGGDVVGGVKDYASWHVITPI
jgi:hypothetical protein